MKNFPEKLLLIIAGTVLFLLGFVLSFATNLNSGNFLMLGMGIGLFWAGIYNNSIRKFLKAHRLGFIPDLLWLCFMIFICFCLFLTGFGMADSSTRCEGSVIVLGCAVNGERVSLPLKYRLDKAIEYYGRNKSATIIVSGGKGQGEDITEAEAMKRYLVENGIPEELIVKEEQATSTYENFMYSKDIIDKLPNKSTVFISNTFHIFRATILAKEVGINANHIHADIQFYMIPSVYLREALAVIKMIIFKR